MSVPVALPLPSESLTEITSLEASHDKADLLQGFYLADPLVLEIRESLKCDHIYASHVAVCSRPELLGLRRVAHARQHVSIWTLSLSQSIGYCYPFTLTYLQSLWYYLPNFLYHKSPLFNIPN